jgi:phosphoribosylglycinamide formyltransferase-1
MKKIAVLFSGEGTNLAYLLEHLHKKNNLEIVVALTNNPNAKGIKIAKNYNVKVEIIDNKKFQNRETFDRVVVNKLQEYSPNLTVLAGFMRILTPIFTDNIIAINLHPSLLPKYKGLNAIERSYKGSDKKAGVSVHWVTNKLDAGEIIIQKSFIKNNNMSFEEFKTHIKKIEKIALKEAIIQILNYSTI